MQATPAGEPGVRRQNGFVTTMFVPDTDPELRSLLTVCQVADDAGPPLTALGDWLDSRHDPRSSLVRLGIRYLQGPHMDTQEFAELERQMLEEGDEVLADWLGLCGRLGEHERTSGLGDRARDPGVRERRPFI